MLLCGYKYTPHTQYPHCIDLDTIHTNVCRMFADVCKQREQYTYTPFIEMYLQCTPGTQMPIIHFHAYTNTRTGPSYTQPCAFTHTQTHNCRSSLCLSLPSFLPLTHPHPTFIWPLGHSAMKRSGSPPPLKLERRMFQVVPTYCFLCLFSSLLLLFGLEELMEK